MRSLPRPVESDSRQQQVLEQQSLRLAELRDKMLDLRNHYSDFKRDYQIQSIQLQRQISAVSHRRRSLEHRVKELVEAAKNSEHEQMAWEMIRRILLILNSFRPDRLDSSEFRMSEDRSMEDDDCSLPIPETPNSFELDPILPIPETPNRFELESILPETETPKGLEFSDSIASRRTPRSTSLRVFYGEPPLRKALAPNGPYVFSLEDGMVTPTLPEGFVRDTPSSRRKGRNR
jgi:hypothetical protein